MSRIRVWIYKAGIRPKPGSIFYSPSLALACAVQDSMKTLVKILKKGGFL